MKKIYRFSAGDQELSERSNGIRTKVFVGEQHVDPMLEYDEHEAESHFYLYESAGQAIGTARWRRTGQGIKLERFAVLSEYRNKGIGSELLKEVLADVISQGIPVYLHSQVRAVSFYERHGFEKRGEMFTEAGIEHFRMEFLPQG